MSGVVFNVERFSISNGPGIRTTAFMKGCTLRCQWCHNPESFSQASQIKLNGKLCRMCKICESVCPQGAHHFEGNRHRIDVEKCRKCGKCVDSCRFGCITEIGREYEAKELADIMLRDSVYYKKSKGGVTFSGGEPTLQIDFIGETVTYLEGIHIAVDTCGNCPEEKYRKMLAIADLVLFDLKHMDSAAHKLYTGEGNEQILSNFRRTIENGSTIQVRYPMIPGVNDGIENIESMAVFLRQYGITHLAVSFYHDFGTCKYYDLQMEPHIFAKYDKETEQEKLDLIRGFGIDPIIV